MSTALPIDSMMLHSNLPLLYSLENKSANMPVMRSVCVYLTNVILNVIMGTRFGARSRQSIFIQ